MLIWAGYHLQLEKTKILAFLMDLEKKSIKLFLRLLWISELVSVWMWRWAEIGNKGCTSLLRLAYEFISVLHKWASQLTHTESAFNESLGVFLCRTAVICHRKPFAVLSAPPSSLGLPREMVWLTTSPVTTETKRWRTSPVVSAPRWRSARRS